MDPRDHLIVFVKAPRPGLVKTRLASEIGPAAAAAAYCQLVAELLPGLAELESVELRFTPDTAAGEIQDWLRQGWRAQPQGPGDLGARLTRAFAAAFAGGSGRVVVIGSDCPEVTRADVENAWRTLTDADVVLGPARDGGYWLIGLSRPCPGLFAEIPWSTVDVVRVTRERAASLNLRVALLRELADVDTARDWREYQKRTRGNGNREGDATLRTPDGR